MEILNNNQELPEMNNNPNCDINNSNGNDSIIVPTLSHNKNEEEIDETPLNKDGFFFN